jgi:hypothetical protein
MILQNMQHTTNYRFSLKYFFTTHFLLFKIKNIVTKN